MADAALEQQRGRSYPGRNSSHNYDVARASQVGNLIISAIRDIQNGFKDERIIVIQLHADDGRFTFHVLNFLSSNGLTASEYLYVVSDPDPTKVEYLSCRIDSLRVSSFFKDFVKTKCLDFAYLDFDDPTAGIFLLNDGLYIYPGHSSLLILTYMAFDKQKNHLYYIENGCLYQSLLEVSSYETGVSMQVNSKGLPCKKHHYREKYLDEILDFYLNHFHDGDYFVLPITALSALHNAIYLAAQKPLIFISLHEGYNDLIAMKEYARELYKTKNQFFYNEIALNLHALRLLVKSNHGYDLSLPNNSLYEGEGTNILLNNKVSCNIFGFNLSMQEHKLCFFRTIISSLGCFDVNSSAILKNILPGVSKLSPNYRFAVPQISPAWRRRLRISSVVQWENLVTRERIFKKNSLLNLKNKSKIVLSQPPKLQGKIPVSLFLTLLKLGCYDSSIALNLMEIIDRCRYASKDQIYDLTAVFLQVESKIMIDKYSQFPNSSFEIFFLMAAVMSQTRNAELTARFAQKSCQFFGLQADVFLLWSQALKENNLHQQAFVLAKTAIEFTWTNSIKCKQALEILNTIIKKDESNEQSALTNELKSSCDKLSTSSTRSRTVSYNNKIYRNKEDYRMSTNLSDELKSDNTTERILERNALFRDSLLWSMMKDFYEKTGTQAWEGVESVPSFITTNSFCAYSYAKFILVYMLEVKFSSLSSPLYIIELGSGTGKFSHLFLTELQLLLTSFTEISQTSCPSCAFGSPCNCLRDMKICYVLTDFTWSNINAWRKNKSLIPWIQLGMLDFAVFDAEKDDSLFLIESKKQIIPGSLSNIVLVANYVFDSLICDIFRVNHGILQEGRITTKAPLSPLACRIQDTSSTFEFFPLESSDYYSDPFWNIILKEYQERFANAQQTFTFPCGALRCIKNIINLTTKVNGSFLLLCTDKGATSWFDIEKETSKEPFLDKQGSFSVSVNFHILESFFHHSNGHSFLPHFRSCHVNTCAFIIDSSIQSTTNTLLNQVFYPINQFSPDSFFTLCHGISSRGAAKLTCREAAAILDLAHYDPDVFWQLRHELRHGIRSNNHSILLNKQWITLLHLVSVRVFRNDYSDDIFLEIARMAILCKDYTFALKALKSSHALLYDLSNHRLDKDKFTTDEELMRQAAKAYALYLFGYCYEKLKEEEKAKRCFYYCLRIFPGFSKADEKIKLLEEKQKNKLRKLANLNKEIE